MQATEFPPGVSVDTFPSLFDVFTSTVTERDRQSNLGFLACTGLEKIVWNTYVLY